MRKPGGIEVCTLASKTEHRGLESEDQLLITASIRSLGPPNSNGYPALSSGKIKRYNQRISERHIIYIHLYENICNEELWILSTFLKATALITFSSNDDFLKYTPNLL